ncbi:MAG: hypothetical protein ACK444_12560 [Flavobacteriales bacterium]|jgi:hypothetical protein
MKSLFFFIGLTGLFTLNAQNASLQGYVNRLNAVADYKADVNVKASIPSISIPVTNAKVYFKKPTKFKVVSNSIVILPKQGMSDLNAFFTNPKKYTQVPGEIKMLNGVRTQLITLLPSEESSEIILAKLYVGTAEPLLYKAIITTKSSGNFTIDYTYSDAKKFALPSRMVFTIDVKKFKMPKSVASNIRSTGPTKSVNQDQKGTITITFSNYLINKGISDSFFTKN